MRAQKLARFLLDRGHDVHVLCAEAPQTGQQSPLGIDPSRIICTDWQDKSASSGLVARLYGAKRHKPDRQISWDKTAQDAALALFQTWQPDVIYALCPPHSTAITAARIAHKTDIPFVTDFSDRWAFNAWAEQSARHRQWDRQKEHAVLRRAAGIVTGSPQWAESYARRFGADKVTISMNGFDPEDYPLHAPCEQDSDRETLTVLHTGPIIPGRRDPRLLFKGVAALGQGAKKIRVMVMGENADSALEIAAEERVQKQVELLTPISHAHAIEAQYSADTLALSMWNDPREAGVVPDALFECIGTRRPLMISGPSKGTVAKIVRKRGLGTFTNEPKVIANTLAHLLAKKRAVGVVPFLPATVRENASAASQFGTIEPLLYEIASETPLQVAAE